MNIKKYQAKAVIGTTGDGKPYSYELEAAVVAAHGSTDRAQFHADLESFEKDAPDRLVLGYGRKETGDLVITSIVRGGTLLMGQIDEAAKNGASVSEINEMKRRERFPDRAAIHGVLFEVGGPAKGTVVDEKLFEAARSAFNIYSYVEKQINKQDHEERGPLMSAFRAALKNRDRPTSPETTVEAIKSTGNTVTGVVTSGPSSGQKIEIEVSSRRSDHVPALTVDLASFKPDDPFYKKGIRAESDLDL